MNSSRRSRRVASLVQRNLANRFVREQQYAQVTISSVELSADLANAKVYVTCMDADDKCNTIIQSLNTDATRLRAQLAEDLALRNTPRLRFIYDPGPEQSARLERLMHWSLD